MLNVLTTSVFAADVVDLNKLCFWVTAVWSKHPHIGLGQSAVLGFVTSGETLENVMSARGGASFTTTLYSEVDWFQNWRSHTLHRVKTR